VGSFYTERMTEDTDLWVRLGVSPGFVRLRQPYGYARLYHEENLSKDIHLKVDGALRLIKREREGVYPGGRARWRDRMEILTLPMRAASLYGLRAHVDRRECWRIWRQTFVWHLRLGRWRYLLGFPALGLLTRLRGPQDAAPR